jgi:hypothetical protein
LLPLRADRLSACGDRTRSAFAFPRSNRHLHHCRHAGERSRSVFHDVNAGHSLRKDRSPRHDGSSQAASTVRDAKAGVEPAFPGRSIRSLHHRHAWKIAKRITSRRFGIWRAAIANPLSVRPVIGVRLSPHSLRQAPRFEACAKPRASPRDPGLPFSNFRTSGAGETKNPPELGSGGSV